jgi:hypothetical protein
MDRIKTRLLELKQLRNDIKTAAGSVSNILPEYKVLQKKMARVMTAIKLLENPNTTEEYIIKEIDHNTKLINTRINERETIESDFSLGHISKEEYKEKIKTITIKHFKAQISFLRFCLPR